MKEGLKRDLTKDDIEFLKELQQEMLTQDTICQANPRFWVLMQTEKDWGVASGYEDGGVWVLENDCERHFEDLDDLKDYLVENEYFYYRQQLDSVSSFEEMKELLEEDGYELEEILYKNVDTIQENTFFLTLKEAREHIKRNYYRYNDTVHPYAMTAWRSSQVEKMYDILLNVDFEKVVKDKINLDKLEKGDLYE